MNPSGSPPKAAQKLKCPLRASSTEILRDDFRSKAAPAGIPTALQSGTPDRAKETAALELLATGENQLDAIVQCGTNMRLLEVIEKLEPVVGIPILGVNTVLFWYAVRENGFNSPLTGGGRLLREF